MPQIKIVTDSSTTLDTGLLETLEITVVPLTVMIDGTVYSDSDLKEGQFLSLMQAAKNVPKTSQPPVGVFAETFSHLAEDGSQIIAILLSHALSGTVEAARQGAILSGADVTVLDSGFTDQASAFQVVEAARLAKAGASKEEILRTIESIRSKTELFVGVSTLENLVKGGRIGRVSGMLSSLLNIRVIMEMKHHQLHPIAKGRGAKTFRKWLDAFASGLSEKPIATIGISYSGSSDFAKEIALQLRPYLPDGREIPILETSSIIQTHTGEGAWAIVVCYE